MSGFVCAECNPKDSHPMSCLRQEPMFLTKFSSPARKFYVRENHDMRNSESCRQTVANRRDLTQPVGKHILSATRDPQFKLRSDFETMPSGTSSSTPWTHRQGPDTSLSLIPPCPLSEESLRQRRRRQPTIRGSSPLRRVRSPYLQVPRPAIPRMLVRAILNRVGEQYMGQ